MDTPAAIADLGPFDHDSRFRTWTARGLLRGRLFDCDVTFGVTSSIWPPPEPDQRMRQAFDECRRNWDALESQLRGRAVQAFREFATYFPGRAEEVGLAADAAEQDVLEHAGQPTLVITRFVYTPRDEDYEVAVQFPADWDPEHGLEIAVEAGQVRD